MTDVVVERCVVRIRRTAGWAWGQSPDALLAAATRALPSLIAARLQRVAAGVPEGNDVRLTAPVRVRAAGTVAELAALASMSFATIEGQASALVTTLDASIDEAFREIDAVVPARASASASEGEPGREQESATGEPAGTLAVSARRTLRAWHVGGVLAAMIEQLAPRAVFALHEAVLGVIAASTTPPAAKIDVARAAVAAAPAGPAVAALRARVRAAAAVVADDETIASAVLRAVVDRVIAAPEPASLAAELSVMAAVPEPARELSHGDTGGEPAQGAQPTDGAPGARASVRRGEEVEIRCALPFLLLPSLHHAGWLAAARTLLEVHECVDDGPALAAALAGKLLPAPERGWMRTRDERAVIGAFAGTAVSEAAMLGAAPRLAPVLDGLATTLRGALERGRRAGTPMVLWQTSTTWYLLDGDGFAVVAAAPSLRGVLARATSLVIVPAACASPATLDWIDLANRTFVTDAPRTRAEPWRTFAGAAGRLWTNDTATPAARLAADTAELTELVAHAGELVEQLDARPAVPREQAGALDAAATLAVTAALGDIGARLFPAERATPILALSRFADLDARVRFDDDVVRVRIPLGRRHADLMRHGFLMTVPAVPWLGDRAVDLGGA